MLLTKGYVLKLSTIGNGLNILMKQGRIQPVYVLSSTKERKRIRKSSIRIILNIIIL